MRWAWSRFGLFAGALFWSSRLSAQTQYYNLDAGRATRVDDAIAVERYALEVVVASLRGERLTGGSERWRVEPKAVYGVLPFTELAVRVPIVRAFAPGEGPSSTGTAGVGIGALHAFNLETRNFPAIALATEVLLPTGQFSGPAASYTVKALVTRTTALARFHLNAGIGTYSVRPVRATDTSCSLFTLTGACANGITVPVPIDLPCGAGPADPAVPAVASPASVASMASMASAAAQASSASSDPGRTSGRRWLFGAGVDHAFPLQSLLVVGDLFAERFVGLYPTTDWTAEVGARQQWTPRLVLDLGAARHFAGAVQSSAATIGLTYLLSTRGLFGQSRR